MKNEKKKHILVYFIKMSLMFLVYFVIQQIFSSLLSINILNQRYGSEAHFEMIWAFKVVIVLLLYKNRYIFTQDRESFKSGLKYIVPELIISGIFLVISIISLSVTSGSINIPAIINQQQL